MKRVGVKEIHKADSPDYLFVDVAVSSSAKPGEYGIIFTKRWQFLPAIRTGSPRGRKRSAERGSFTTSDLIYLICPDRFANADKGNDNTDDTAEG